MEYKSNLVPLTPAEIPVDKMAQFEEELNSVLSGQYGTAIRNISITGNYSVGKSSHLKSFQERNPKYQYKTVSLAKFANNSNNKLKEESDSSDELATRQVVEESIVQQLLYSVQAKSLPNSRFRRISYQSKFSVFVNACIFLFSLASYTYVFQVEKIPSALLTYFEGFPAGLFSLGCLLSVFYVSLKVVNFAGNIHFSNFDFKGIKFNGTSSKSSALHRYIDEIVYFFESGDTDVVIFEDLDRFEDVGVFNSLRELNLILNNYENIKRPIYFIYAVRDCLFLANDRTKFFDLIIPIVPVVHSSNAFEIFKRLLEANGERVNNDEKVSITTSHLQSIALYFDDLRLINNVVNEFTLYKGQLPDPVGNKLLSMIAIKNLYPKEYAQLILRNGKIYDAITGLNEFKEEISRSTRKEREELEEQIERLESCSVSNLREVNMLFWSLYSQSAGLNIRHVVKIDDLTYENFVSSFEGSPSNQSIRIYDTSNRQHSVRANTVTNALGETIHQAQQKFFASIEELKSRKALLIKNEQQISTYSIGDVINHSAGRKLIADKLGSDLGLVLLCIRNQTLANDYEFYISRFYEGSLTKNDIFVIQNLKQGWDLDIEHKVDKPKLVLSKLSLSELPARIPASLVKALLLNPNVTSFELSDWVIESNDYQLYYQSIGDVHTKSEFVKETLNYKLHFGKILKYLDRDEEALSEFIFIMKGIDPVDMHKNYENMLNEATFNIRDVDLLFSYESDRFDWESYLLNGVSGKFKHISKGISIGTAIKLKQNNSVVFTKENISTLVSILHQIDECNISYSSVRDTGDSELLAFVESNINEFISFYSCDNDGVETPEHFLYLLSLQTLEVSTRDRLLESYTHKYEQLNFIHPSLWDLLLDNNFINLNYISIPEIYHHYEKFDVNVVNQVNYEFDDEMCKEFKRLFKDKPLALTSDFISSNITNEIKKEIFNDIEFNLEELEKMEESNSESLNQLVEHSTIPFESGAFAFIFDTDNKLAFDYLLGVDVCGALPFKQLSLLDDKVKVAIVNHEDSELSLVRKKLLEELISSDINFEDELVSSVTLDLLLTDDGFIIKPEDWVLSGDFLSFVIDSKVFDIETIVKKTLALSQDKALVLKTFVTKYTVGSIEDLISAENENKHKVTINATESTKYILNIMKKLNLIRSFEIEFDGRCKVHVYRAKLNEFMK